MPLTDADQSGAERQRLDCSETVPRTALEYTVNEYYRQLLTRAMEGAANAMLITSPDGRIEWANSAFCTLSGYPLDELLGKTPSLLKSGAQDEAFYAELWSTVSSGRPWQGELLERASNGDLYRVNQVITPLIDERGRITHLLAIQHSISQLDRERSRLRYEALHDVLTRLPNRRCLLERLELSLQDAERNGTPLALLFIDLDGFKPVNDRHGHAHGDKLLQAVARRLRRGVRDADIVARMSGDEFVVLLTGLASPASVEVLANGLARRIARPFRIDGTMSLISASIGIARFPEHGRDSAALLQAADQAMYQVKAKGGNGVRMAAPGEVD